MSDYDEEWERSELALKKLQIEPQINDQVIFFNSSTTSSTSNNLNNSNENEIIIDGPEAPLNSALIDALQNPRERMNVLKYEDRILKFVKSK